MTETAQNSFSQLGNNGLVPAVGKIQEFSLNSAGPGITAQ